MSIKRTLPWGSLTSWSLVGFKAISKGEVTFPGLTVLLGANSSGKSSVIQSMLSLAQVVQGNFGNRYPLTGELTRLGSISEVSNHGLSLTASFEQAVFSVVISQDEIGEFQDPTDPHSEHDEARLKSLWLDWGVKAGDSFQNQFSVELIEIPYDSDLAHDLQMGKLNRKDLPLARYSLNGTYPCIGACGADQMVEYHVLPENLSIRWSPSSTTFQLDAGQLLANFGMFDQFVLDNVLLANYTEESFGTQMVKAISESKLVPDEDIIRFTKGLNLFFSSQPECVKFSDFSGLFDLLVLENASLLWRFSSVSEEFESGTLPESLMSALSSLVALPSWLSWTTELNSCWDNWAEIFNDSIASIPESVRYLGPLRLDPQELQSPNRSTNPIIPVGRSGENATHLIWQSERENPRMPYPTPDGSGANSLTDAISAWLEYLELGSPISFTNLGNAGFATRVGHRSVYNLGTGVSQIFPLLALCLSEQTDRVILIEQPELHLHPSSQQKLADFFIAMVDSGRRLVVETHSEYMITRLRRRVAVDKVDHSKYELIFVERGDSGSTFTVSKLAETGQFSYWPKGFFGQIEDDLVAILEADVRRGNTDQEP